MPGKSVLITGCSDGGLGAALALAFHKKGYRVLATARNTGKLGQMKAHGIETLSLDVLSADSIKACVSEVSKSLDGKLDVLVNNAGAGYSMPVLDIDLDELRDVYELNVFSLVTVSKAFFPLLRAAHGMIVNNTSIAGTPLGGVPLQAAYNSTKAAAGSITRSLRLELEPFGVKVVDLKTGAVKTNFFANVGDPKLPSDSIYQIARQQIEHFMGGGDLMTNAMTADTWAGLVVSDLSQANPPYEVWRGTQASQVRLALFFPAHWFDSMIKKIVGLTALEQRVKADQQNAIKQA